MTESPEKRTPQPAKSEMGARVGREEKRPKKPRRRKDGPRLPLRFNILWLLPPLLALIFVAWEVQHAATTWAIIYDGILYKTPYDQYLRLTKHLNALNHFPEGVPIVMAIIGIWVYKRNYRSTIAPFLIALGLASATTGIGKEFFGRARPHISIRMEVDKRQADMEEFIARYPNAPLKLEAGDYWLGMRFPKFWERPFFRGDFASFPSGHATSAFVFAFWLSLVFGRLKWLWYFAAVGTCFARIRFRRHYPGDVIAGAAIGWMFSYLVFCHPTSARIGHWAQRKVESYIGTGRDEFDRLGTTPEQQAGGR